MQTERAKEETITSSEGIVYSWDLTQKDIDEITPDVKTITVDGEEAVERVTGQIREGLWVQLLGTDGTDEVDRTPPSLTPARVTGGEGITLEELGRRVKVSLKGEQGLVDEKVNWVAGSDYEMSIEGSEVGADAHMRLDEDLFFFFPFNTRMQLRPWRGPLGTKGTLSPGTGPDDYIQNNHPRKHQRKSICPSQAITHPSH